MISAHTPLALPRMPRAPSTFTFRRDVKNPKLARFAKILLDLGLLTDADAPNPRRISERTLIERAINRWSARVLGRTLEVFGGVYLVVNPDSPAECHQSYQYTGDDAPEVDPDECVILAICPWKDGAEWILERSCTPLHARAPELAEHALHLIDYGAGRSVPVVTPAWAHESGEMFYDWDHEDAREAPALTSTDFCAAIPEWVRRPRRRLSPKALQERRFRHEPVAHAAAALAEAIEDRHAAMPDVAGMTHACFGAVLRWSPKDPIGQIVDDYVNDAQNGGECTSDYSWHFIELDTDATRRTLDAVARLLRTLACTDRLISLLAEKQR